MSSTHVLCLFVAVLQFQRTKTGFGGREEEEEEDCTESDDDEQQEQVRG